MRWTVRDQVYNEHGEGAVRPRLWLCLVAAIAGGVIATLAWSVSALALRAARPWVLEHWVWVTLPVIAFLIGMLVRAYLIMGKFFPVDDYVRMPILDVEVTVVSPVGFGVGTILAVPVCCILDGYGRPWSHLVKVFPGDGFGIILFAATTLAIAFVLRRWEYPIIGLGEIAFACISFLLVAAILYLAVTALVSIDWQQVWEWILSRLTPAWPVALLVFVLVPQVIWFSKNSDYGSVRGSTPKRLAVLSVVVLLDFLLVMYTVLYWLPGIVVNTAGLSKSQAASALARERQTLLAITAAIAAGLTLIYTHLRHQLDRDANATGRYAEAVQQLGSENMSIRLGGVFALGRVARDSPGDRETIFQLLASFVKDRRFVRAFTQ